MHYTQIHRFHERVAISVPGCTQYLTAAEAIQVGNKLVQYGRDVKKRTFLESVLGTFNRVLLLFLLGVHCEPTSLERRTV